MAQPLVSVLIPAYNARHFGEALASARAQSYAPLEIVVCDDSPGSDIEAVTKGANDPRIRYIRNPRNLGFAGNFTQCFVQARGEFVKFLNDDDRLRPHCVAVLAGALINTPAAQLATSRRVVIDETGKIAGDIVATTPITHVSALLHGGELGDFVLANSTNFIGEPSTVLFRRASLALEGESVFRWGGRDYHCLADLSVWLRLLARGPAFYAATPLSEFRLHRGQEQRRDEVRLSCLVERLWIARQARASGFLAAPSLWRTALENARKLGTAWLQSGERDEATRRAVEEFVAELDRELRAAA